MARTWFYDDHMEQCHVSEAIDTTDAELFAHDRRTWAATTDGAE